MILDTLNQAATYRHLHPLFGKAFEWIAAQHWGTVADGKMDIGDGMKAILSTGDAKTKEQSLEKFECHNRNIDIQVCLQGNETMGWKPRVACTQPKGAYNREKDVFFFADAPDTFFDLQAGQFAVFFPDDVHAPMIGSGKIRKLVIKVPV
ncbi:MAG TPA: YhcH/YjgK/YiaL family protein [Lacibacter sp.]|nr:YhcH/YjgK/YiaL family protein [Lacibacter sp.]HMO89192.1 YhcH/YjgK/YiaL family protein [Lacibacter sp.]HMP86148.1 YhcH/YjgK/YiaL family protein [Lacibacter sp.]